MLIDCPIKRMEIYPNCGFPNARLNYLWFPSPFHLPRGVPWCLLGLQTEAALMSCKRICEPQLIPVFMFRLRAAGKRATGKVKVKWGHIMADKDLGKPK